MRCRNKNAGEDFWWRSFNEKQKRLKTKNKIVIIIIIIIIITMIIIIIIINKRNTCGSLSKGITPDITCNNYKS